MALSKEGILSGYNPQKVLPLIICALDIRPITSDTTH